MMKYSFSKDFSISVFGKYIPAWALKANTIDFESDLNVVADDEIWLSNILL